MTNCNESVDSKDKKNYLPPQDFFKFVMESKTNGYITPELSEAFMVFAEKLSHHRYWVRYTHLREDIISQTLLKCVSVYEKFRPYKGSENKDKVWEGEEYYWETHNNPHAFFTTTCMNELRSLMKSEYNQTNIVNKIKCEEGLDPSYAYEEVYANEHRDDSDEDTDDIEEFDVIEEHEEPQKPQMKKIKGLEW